MQSLTFAYLSIYILLSNKYCIMSSVPPTIHAVRHRWKSKPAFEYYSFNFSNKRGCWTLPGDDNYPRLPSKLRWMESMFYWLTKALFRIFIMHGDQQMSESIALSSCMYCTLCWPKVEVKRNQGKKSIYRNAPVPLHVLCRSRLLPVVFDELKYWGKWGTSLGYLSLNEVLGFPFPYALNVIRLHLWKYIDICSHLINTGVKPQNRFHEPTSKNDLLNEI